MSFFKLLHSNGLANLFFWLILLTPVLFAYNTIYASIFGRGIWFFILLALLLSASLFTMQFHAIKQLFRHPIFWIILGWLALSTVSAVLGENFFVSFWGPVGRLGGLITMINVFLLFILAVTQIQYRGVGNVLRIMTHISSIVALYGIIQFLRNINSDFLFNERLVSSLGNPLFLGSFLLLTVFFALYFALTSHSRWAKILFGTEFIVLFSAIVMTISRGPNIALCLGLIVFIVGGVIILSRKWQTAVLRLLAVAVGLALIGGTGYLLREPLGIERLFNYSMTGSIQSRLITYEALWKSVLERPLLGYGLENVNLAHDLNYNPIREQSGYKESFTSRAHNVFIDQLTTNGFAGGVFLLFFIGAVGWLIVGWFRRSKKIRAKLSALTFMATAIAYFVQDLTLFETPMVYIYGILILACLVVVSRRQPFYLEHYKAKWPQLMLASTVSVAAIILILNVYQPAYANGVRLNRAMLAQSAQNYDYAAQQYKGIEESPSPWNHFFFRKSYAGFVTEQALRLIYNNEIESAKEILLDGVAAINKLADREPSQIQIKLAAAYMEVILDSIDPSRGNLGDKLFEELVDKYPNRRTTVKAMWGTALFSIGRDWEALSHLKDATLAKYVSGEPHFWYAVINDDVGGDDNITLQHLQIAIKKGLGDVATNSSALQFAVKFLVESGDFEDAIILQEKLVKLPPKVAKHYIGLAVLYKSAGKSEKASQLAREVLKQFPNLTSEEREAAQSMIH